MRTLRAFTIVGTPKPEAAVSDERVLKVGVRLRAVLGLLMVVAVFGCASKPEVAAGPKTKSKVVKKATDAKGVYVQILEIHRGVKVRLAAEQRALRRAKEGKNFAGRREALMEALTNVAVVMQDGEKRLKALGTAPAEVKPYLAHQIRSCRAAVDLIDKLKEAAKRGDVAEFDRLNEESSRIDAAQLAQDAKLEAALRKRLKLAKLPMPKKTAVTRSSGSTVARKAAGGKSGLDRERQYAERLLRIAMEEAAGWNVDEAARVSRVRSSSPELRMATIRAVQGEALRQKSHTIARLRALGPPPAAAREYLTALATLFNFEIAQMRYIQNFRGTQAEFDRDPRTQPDSPEYAALRRACGRTGMDYFGRYGLANGL